MSQARQRAQHVRLGAAVGDVELSCLLEARGQAMGTKTMEEFLKAAPKLSLKEMGLIDRPSAPLLGVNGKLDDQAPVEISALRVIGVPSSDAS